MKTFLALLYSRSEGEQMDRDVYCKPNVLALCSECAAKVSHLLCNGCWHVAIAAVAVCAVPPVVARQLHAMLEAL